MSIFSFWRALFGFAFGPLYFFNKSSSATTNLNQTDNSNIGAQSEYGPAIAVHGEGNNVELTDAGAVAGSLKLAGDVVKSQQQLALELSGHYAENVAGLVNRSEQSLATIAARNSASEATNLTGVVKWGIIALAAVFAVRALRAA